jgi:hypothetical protein
MSGEDILAINEKKIEAHDFIASLYVGVPLCLS